METSALSTLKEEQQIVLFDGVCNLCSGGVQFILKRDRKDLFRFASLQSELGQQLLAERQIDPKTSDSMVLIQPGKAFYLRSDAALNDTSVVRIAMTNETNNKKLSNTAIRD